MLYIPKIGDYLKILTVEEVKDFVAINFSEYFKSIREEQKSRKVAKLLYIFLTESRKISGIKYSVNCIHHYNIEILNFFDPELQLINTKAEIKTNLKTC